MFALPRPPSDGDVVTVTGSLNNPDSFTLNLLTGYSNPDYNNIACQLEANFPTSSNGSNGIILRIIDNGQSEVISGSYLNHTANGMMSGSTFEFKFKFESINGMTAMSIFVNGSILEQIVLKHDFDQISFLELKGDVYVNGLAFQFA